MHDLPYVKSNLIGPETVSTMTKLCISVRSILPQDVTCGVQVLAAGNEHAIAVALAAGCDFIRAEGFVFGHVADEGYIDACAGQLLRYRNRIKADHIHIITDIKKKHSSHAITSDVNIIETAKSAELFLSDGLILTGSSTGKEANAEELNEVKSNVKIPVIIGSGITDKNIKKFIDADAFIVGSNFKRDGSWRNDIDESRVSKFIRAYYESKLEDTQK